MSGKNKKDTKVKKILSDLAAIYDEAQRKPAPAAHEEVEVLKAEVAKIMNLVEQLLKLQPSEFKSEENKAEKEARFKRFAEWLKKEAPHCGVGEKFEFDPFVPEGSGVKALVDLQDDEHFISIPRCVMMSAEDAIKSKSCGSVVRDDPMCKSMPNLALAVYVMCERLCGQKSFFYPYLQVLPASSTFNLPLYFSMAEMEALSGSPTHLEALKLYRNTVRQYLYLLTLFRRASSSSSSSSSASSSASASSTSSASSIRPPSSFSFEDYRWAVAVVMSRQNQIPKRQAQNDADMTLALIPGWDMCNGRNGRFTTYFDTESDENQSYTMQPVKKGDPIYIHYGNRANQQLFLYQGFVLTQHEADQLTLPLSLDPTNPLLKIQALIAAKLSPPVSSAFPLSLPLPRSLLQTFSELSDTAANNHSPEASPDKQADKQTDESSEEKEAKETEAKEKEEKEPDPREQQRKEQQRKQQEEAEEEDRVRGQRAMGFLRIAAMNKAEAGQALKNGVASALSVRCEAAAYRRLLHALQARLKAYPTSMQDDDTMLQDKSLSERMKVAVLMRRSEKQLLHRAIAQLQAIKVPSIDSDSESA